jgi:hypothetical protein
VLVGPSAGKDLIGDDDETKTAACITGSAHTHRPCAARCMRAGCAPSRVARARRAWAGYSLYSISQQPRFGCVEGRGLPRPGILLLAVPSCAGLGQWHGPRGHYALRRCSAGSLNVIQPAQTDSLCPCPRARNAPVGRSPWHASGMHVRPLPRKRHALCFML